MDSNSGGFIEWLNGISDFSRRISYNQENEVDCLIALDQKRE